MTQSGFDPYGQWDGRPLAAPRRRPRRGSGGARHWGVVFAVLLVVAAAGAVFRFVDVERPANLVTSGCGQVQSYPLDAGFPQHIEGRIDYTWSPPYGGPHNPQPLPRKPQVVRAGLAPPLVAERAVHNLEHGYVVVWYDRDAELDDVNAIEDELNGRRLDKVLVVPWDRTRFDGPSFRLAAWGYLQPCERPDADAIEAFLADHGGENGAAPERDAP